MSEQLNVFERRLSRLERQNRNLKLWLVIAIAIAVTPRIPGFVSVLAQQPAGAVPAVVRAESFEIVAAGKTIATLKGKPKPNGYTLAIYQGAAPFVEFDRTVDGGVLAVLKGNSTRAITLDTGKSGGGVYVAGTKDDHAVAILSADRNGWGDLRLGTGDNRALVDLYAQTAGGNLDLYRPSGTADERRFAIALRAKDSNGPGPYVGVYDANGIASVELASGLGASGGGIVHLLKPGGKIGILLEGASSEGSPEMTFWNDRQVPVATVNTSSSGRGRLALFDEFGSTVLFIAPPR